MVEPAAQQLEIGDLDLDWCNSDETSTSRGKFRRSRRLHRIHWAKSFQIQGQRRLPLANLAFAISLPSQCPKNPTVAEAFTIGQHANLDRRNAQP